MLPLTLSWEQGSQRHEVLAKTTELVVLIPQDIWLLWVNPTGVAPAPQLWDGKRYGASL